jgi:hypothetical protein
MSEEKEKSSLLNIPSVAEVMATSPTEKLADFYKGAFTRTWYFERWLDKLIITACFFWSAWSLGSWIWRLF